MSFSRRTCWCKNEILPNQQKEKKKKGNFIVPAVCPVNVFVIQKLPWSAQIATHGYDDVCVLGVLDLNGKTPTYGGVGYFSNEHGFSVESSLQIMVVETKQFVGSNVNVIQTRHTYGQHSCRAAASKRRALEFYSYDRNCCMFLISKCREGTCEMRTAAQWRLPKKMCFSRRKNRNLTLCSRSLFASTPNVHRPRSQSPFHFDIRNIWQTRS